MEVEQQLVADVAAEPAPAFVSPTLPPGWQQPPNYQPVNLAFPGIELVSQQPPVYTIPNFLSADECQALMREGEPYLVPSPVVGKGSGEVSQARTSQTCYFAREDLPFLMERVYHLLGKPSEHVELPQIGRYLNTQYYRAHFDAFDLTNEDGRRFAANGGQRVATVLIYLNDVAQGGHTSFDKLNMSIRPEAGKCVLFFPATLDGVLDEQALHAANPAEDVKWVSQIWVRQGEYHGVPSARITPLV